MKDFLTGMGHWKGPERGRSCSHCWHNSQTISFADSNVLCLYHFFDLICISTPLSLNFFFFFSSVLSTDLICSLSLFGWLLPFSALQIPRNQFVLIYQSTGKLNLTSSLGLFYSPVVLYLFVQYYNVWSSWLKGCSITLTTVFKIMNLYMTNLLTRGSPKQPSQYSPCGQFSTLLTHIFLLQ